MGSARIKEDMLINYNKRAHSHARTLSRKYIIYILYDALRLPDNVNCFI